MKVFYESLEKIKSGEIKISNIVESKTCVVAKIIYNNKTIAEYRNDMFTNNKTIKYSEPILECNKFIILDEYIENPDIDTLKEFINKGISYSKKMESIDWVQNV